VNFTWLIPTDNFQDIDMGIDMNIDMDINMGTGHGRRHEHGHGYVRLNGHDTEK
jgi:hypothetical protein